MSAPTDWLAIARKHGYAFSDECVASGQSCGYGPNGINGERQCKYCGAPTGQHEASGATAIDAANFIDLKADAYATENGTVDYDTNSLEFGSTEREDYYNSLRELADEVRALPSTRAQVPRDAVVDDLAMLVRRLVRRLEKTNPGADLQFQALDYLKRKGLQGSPLRDAAPSAPVGGA